MVWNHKLDKAYRNGCLMRQGFQTSNFMIPNPTMWILESQHTAVHGGLKSSKFNNELSWASLVVGFFHYYQPQVFYTWQVMVRFLPTIGNVSSLQALSTSSFSLRPQETCVHVVFSDPLGFSVKAIEVKSHQKQDSARKLLDDLQYLRGHHRPNPAGHGTVLEWQNVWLNMV